jgi:hypothetical protein
LLDPEQRSWFVKEAVKGRDASEGIVEQVMGEGHLMKW